MDSVKTMWAKSWHLRENKNILIIYTHTTNFESAFSTNFGIQGDLKTFMILGYFSTSGKLVTSPTLPSLEVALKNNQYHFTSAQRETREVYRATM